MLPLFACQKKSSKSKCLLVLMLEVFQVGVPLSLPSNKIIAQGPANVCFSPSFCCWLYLHYWNFALFFFFPFRRPTYLLLVQFCPTKTILTFVGTQVNPGFWVEHSNHYNFITTRLRVTFKQKVQKFKFSTIMLFTDLKPRASTGKLISLPLASRKSWFDILWEQHILTNRDHNLLY